MSGATRGRSRLHYATSLVSWAVRPVRLLGEDKREASVAPSG